MRDDLAGAICQALAAEGYDYQLITDYQCRGSFGTYTAAIVVENVGWILMACILHPEYFSDKLKHDLTHLAFGFRLRSDNFGTEMVYY